MRSSVVELPSATSSKRFQHAAAGLVLFLSALLLVLSARNESPTTDEPLHATRGLAYWWTEDASLSYAHPPLGNALVMLPAALALPRVDFREYPAWKGRVVEGIAEKYFKEDYGERRKAIVYGRLTMCFITLSLAIYLYWFCLGRWGFSTAFLVLLFYALHPTVLAHGRLVTTDVPIMVFATLAIGEFIRFVETRSWGPLLTWLIATGAALATKYNGVALAIPFITVIPYYALTQRGRYAGLARPRALLSGAGHLFLVLIVSALCINAAYRFQETGLTVHEILEHPEPQNHMTRNLDEQFLEKRTPLPALPQSLRVPLPYTYVVGFATVKEHDRIGHDTTFFGEFRRQGTPLYFPVMFLIKTPIVELSLLILGPFLLFRMRRKPSLACGALGILAAAYFALSLRSNMNIGVRHLLPIFPAIAILAARGGVLFWERVRAKRFAMAGLAFVATGHVSGLAWAFPDYLSDFNVLVGGRTGGQRISIVGEEWGQDVIRLASVAKERALAPLYYSPDAFASALEMKLHNVRYEPLKCGKSPPAGAWVALHARAEARYSKKCYPWALKIKPESDIYGHMLIYRMPGKAAE